MQNDDDDDDDDDDDSRSKINDSCIIHLPVENGAVIFSKSISPTDDNVPFDVKARSVGG